MYLYVVVSDVIHIILIIPSKVCCTVYVWISNYIAVGFQSIIKFLAKEKISRLIHPIGKHKPKYQRTLIITGESIVDTDYKHNLRIHERLLYVFCRDVKWPWRGEGDVIKRFRKYFT